MTSSTEVSSAPPSSLSIPLPAAGLPRPYQAPGAAQLGPILIVFVSILAFLLASFPARNSDLLLHLARGRLLAHLESPSMTDPDLAFDRWGNQTWLYDLLCFGCYQLLGGVGLVLAKALLAAGIALLLLRQSRSTAGWGLAALCTSLAVLSMSKYLVLQPATVSYFLLTLALAVLCFPKAEDKEASVPWLSWPLLLVFVAWANTDRWFPLGLGVAALMWLGEVVDAARAAGPSAGGWLPLLLRRGFMFFVLAAACLVNPSLLNAFVLADDLRGYGLTAGQTISPFEPAYFATVGWNPASLAYFVLLGLSLLSFAVDFPQVRWQRLLPWLGLAVLSGWQARTIPFFAVVAGPVLAWNIRDIRERRSKDVRDWTASERLVRLGQALTVLTVVVLVVCAWPGWLQSPPYGSRRWALDLSPSLERGAETVRRWRQEGKMTPDSAGMHLSTETVYAFAWYCPDEKRFRLPAQVTPEESRRRMHSAGVDHVLVYDTDRERLAVVLSGLVMDEEQWPLIYQEGDLAVFGWRDPDRPGSAQLFRGAELDLDRLAFHPAEDKKVPSDEAVQESQRAWWQAFWKPAPKRSMDRAEALMHLLHAEALGREAPLRHKSEWENLQAAGLIGAAAGSPFPAVLADTPLRLVLFGPQLDENARPEQFTPLDRMVFTLQGRYTRPRDDVPPALYYLALRAARRAVADNPEDGPAYLLLGESYLGLLYATRERSWADQRQPLANQLPQFRNLRQIQASTAFNRALALRPDLVQAHFHLGQLYEDMGYYDLALKHWQTYCRLRREAGPPPGLTPQEFKARQALNEERVEQLAAKVKNDENFVTLGSADRPVRDSARMAYNKGLRGKALDLLLESDLAAFGNEGMELELELLLGVGRVSDVQDWLQEQYKDTLGALPYHWFHTCASAALGEYTRAEDECENARRSLTQRPNSQEMFRLREYMVLQITRHMMDGMTSRANLWVLADQEALTLDFQGMAQRLRQQSELSVVRGLLALEEGEMEEAKSAFRAALSLWQDEKAAAAGSGLDFHGRIIAQECLRWLE